MTSLRTMGGCDSKKIHEDYGTPAYGVFLKNSENMIREGFLTEISGVYFLTEKGKLFSDMVACELFFKS
jgi:coproporphyrinogen III oxidase-like Fe-S oxidoreductase